MTTKCDHQNMLDRSNKFYVAQSESGVHYSAYAMQLTTILTRFYSMVIVYFILLFYFKNQTVNIILVIKLVIIYYLNICYSCDALLL